MEFHEGDPFREERHFSRLAVFYALFLVLLVGIGFALYRFRFQNQPPPTDRNSVIREEVEEALDES